MPEKLLVRDIYRKITRRATTVRENEDILSVARKLLDYPLMRTIYVVDSTGHLKGLITIKELIKVVYPEYIPRRELMKSGLSPLKIASARRAEDIMAPPIWVNPDDKLTVALKKMFENDLRELPVVDSDLRVIGDLNMLEILQSWVEKNEGKRH